MGYSITQFLTSSLSSSSGNSTTFNNRDGNYIEPVNGAIVLHNSTPPLLVAPLVTVLLSITGTVTIMSLSIWGYSITQFLTSSLSNSSGNSTTFNNRDSNYYESVNMGLQYYTPLLVAPLVTVLLSITGTVTIMSLSMRL